MNRVFCWDSIEEEDLLDGGLYGAGDVDGQFDLEYSFIALLIAVSLVLGLVLFLSEYLLYRYDHDEEQE